MYMLVVRRETTDTGKRRVLRASPEVVLNVSKKYANGALEHYNKRKKIKFELVDVKHVNNMLEEGDFYTHVNFTARSSKEGSEEELFFSPSFSSVAEGRFRVASL
ncbi:unnamed protein product [Urochloa humidicola]